MHRVGRSHYRLKLGPRVRSAAALDVEARPSMPTFNNDVRIVESDLTLENGADEEIVPH